MKKKYEYPPSFTPKWHSEYSRKWQAERRKLAISLLGSKCVKCGHADTRALHIDHIIPVGKIRENQTAIFKKIVNSDLSNYQLLCANCNLIKVFENSELRNKYSMRN